jgi:hypothetical protein
MKLGFKRLSLVIASLTLSGAHLAGAADSKCYQVNGPDDPHPIQLPSPMPSVGTSEIQLETDPVYGPLVKKIEALESQGCYQDNNKWLALPASQNIDPKAEHPGSAKGVACTAPDLAAAWTEGDRQAFSGQRYIPESEISGTKDIYFDRNAKGTSSDKLGLRYGAREACMGNFTGQAFDCCRAAFKANMEKLREEMLSDKPDEFLDYRVEKCRTEYRETARVLKESCDEKKPSDFFLSGNLDLSGHAHCIECSLYNQKVRYPGCTSMAIDDAFSSVGIVDSTTHQPVGNGPGPCAGLTIHVSTPVDNKDAAQDVIKVAQPGSAGSTGSDGKNAESGK